MVASMEYNNFSLQSSNCISGVAAFVAAERVVAVELTRYQPSEPCRDVQCMLFYICHKIINIMTFATMYTWWNLTEEACWNHMQDCRGALKLKSDSGQRQPKKKNNGKLDERKYSQTMQHMLVDRHHFKIVRLFPFRLRILELRWKIKKIRRFSI